MYTCCCGNISQTHPCVKNQDVECSENATIYTRMCTFLCRCGDVSECPGTELASGGG